MDPKTDAASNGLDFDVIIIGAGISGINAAYRVQNGAPPGTSYVILESRDSMGGTWDIWRYPGIRSDSDVFTFSFAWNPWPGRESLASGEKIKRYMMESARQAGIDRHVRLGHKVVSANWSSAAGCWEVAARQRPQEQPQLFRGRFVFLGTGYYDYQQPLHSAIPGIDNFRGRLIAPQHWPRDYDYTGQEMVVIGSGATAISIVPAVAGRAKHVTMLQRSPSWYFPLSQYGTIARLLAAVLPASASRRMNRYRWLLQSQLLLFVCRNMPTVAAGVLRFLTAMQLPKDADWDRDFQPRYGPWDQRLCIVMDGDLFSALRSRQASVVTGHIDTVAEHGIVLKSGQVLHADAIVVATGIRLKFGGDVALSVDGEPVNPCDKFAWKQCMLQDVPNLVFSFGYAENSWTLAADCAATVMVRVLRELQRHKMTCAAPQLDASERESMAPRPLWRLTSTYLRNMASVFPKGGTGQWRPRWYYFYDVVAATWGGLKGLAMK
ncbi:Flavin monooxygenase-like protein [Metarhizium album ARSEF 1941]|uniref:Flavin monooxygenase-like protein n=1 Tax=Metarhizium album (strain ARSEF 1941) TaxID=1081103 RepID=A0A0B2WPY9_METAS|nr:Flavin monooxygenase-like protein [Metarhizium album ARSEF 1941]KHN96083.1 Flavin monooxygenase-like protein [Metarhizium album ARSEF 1941]